MVVNAVGDIFDPETGQLIAGEQHSLEKKPQESNPFGNSTSAVGATNASHSQGVDQQDCSDGIPGQYHWGSGGEHTRTSRRQSRAQRYGPPRLACRGAERERNKMSKDLAYLMAKKDQHEPIVMVTCYDYPTAQIEDEAGVDIIFVGDSVGTNMLGYAAETEVTMEDMLHHLKAVRRGVQQAYLLVDLPHGSYPTPEMALANARRLLACGPNGVKLEGGIEQVDVVRALVAQGIEVCGHLGFTPQTMGTKGRVQGRSLAEGKALVRSALALEAAGLSLLVLELASEPISLLIAQHLRVPTIGIGAGRFCDGQVLVITDILGISPMERKLFKRYEHWRERSLEAVHRYKHDVQQRIFPAEANTFTRISEEETAALAQWIDQGMPPEMQEE